MSNTENLANVAKHIVASSSGNVGVGTSSPSSYGTNITTLDVRGTSGSGIKLGTAANYGFYYNSGNGYVQTFDSSPILFVINNVERMRVDTSGVLQVGGTTVANTTGYVNSRTNTRAWARWTGSTVAIASSYNVSSVTRSSAGQYVVNFTTALADANYAPMMSCSGDVSYNGYGIFAGMTSAPTTSSFAMWTKAYNGTAADANVVQIAVFGN